ncbi:MAG: hypothetical protein AAF798_01955 [Bacteroidota bacterium]
MTVNKKYNFSLVLAAALLLLLPFSCSRELEDLEQPTFPVNGDIFIDGFSGGLEYVAFGDSKTSAFEVDETVFFRGDASMRFDVPNVGDPLGGYAGGTFIDAGGRDMSGFDALTFWIRGSEATTIGEIGFGVDPTLPGFSVILNDVPVSTAWTKVIIPIPDPSVVTRLRVFLFYAATPQDGKGYSFWIDEARFEKLGTIANPRPAILLSIDAGLTAETGDRFQIDGLSMIHNLPNGLDQRAFIGPGYFSYESSNTSVAIVDELGVVTVIDAGEATITAEAVGIAAEGSFTVTSTGAALLPPQPAPAPTRSQDSVISMYSNVYNDVTVDTWNPFWEFSTTLVEDKKIGDDDVKRYKQLNFVGILTEAEKINASEMTHFHMDIWTPDATTSAAFRVLLVDFGADGNFGGGDDSSHEVTITTPTLQTEQWVSLDIPLSDFVGLVNRNNIAQLVLSGDLPNLFVDNVYYYKSGDTNTGGPNEPEMAAPTPSVPAGDVISLFSDAYTDVPVDTWRTEWSAAAFEDVLVDGNPTKKYAALDFAGIETVMNQIDATGMTHVHMDVWSPNSTQFRFKIVDFGPDGGFDGGDDTEHELLFEMPATGTWVSYDIPLSDFVGLTNRQNLAQYILASAPAGASTIFVDNFFFYNGDGGTGNPTEPQMGAPAPTQAAGDVISLFSDEYSNVPVDTWRTEWSAADFEEVMVAGNTTYRYTNLDFVGIETVGNQIDATGMTHVHMNVWSPNSTQFRFKIVDFGPDGAFDGGDDTEHELLFEMPATGTWVTYDIPLADFVGLTNRQNLAQYILASAPAGASTIFVDDFFFYNNDGGGSDPTEPQVAPPTPPQDPANVISLFSDAYNDVAVDTWRTEWSMADFEDVTLAGNPLKKYSNLDFVGIETVGNQIDATGMTHIHIDVWSADHDFFAIKLVDFGPDGAFDGGDDTEHELQFEMPATGTWVSYDLPLADFINLTNRANIAQYIMVGRPTGTNTIFIDNVYFYNE